MLIVGINDTYDTYDTYDASDYLIKNVVLLVVAEE